MGSFFVCRFVSVVGDVKPGFYVLGFWLGYRRKRASAGDVCQGLFNGSVMCSAINERFDIYCITERFERFEKIVVFDSF